MIELDEINQSVGGEVSLLPWEIRPYLLGTWWEMKPFRVYRFLAMVRSFQRLTSLGGFDEEVSAETREKASRMMASFAKECEEIGLSSTADQFRRLKLAWESGKEYSEINVLLPDLLNRLEDESKRKIMMSIDTRYAAYFTNAQFFDSADPLVPQVSTQFASASEDIAEAGKCLACGRSTACVMHLNRVMESGLKALASACGVGPQNDWGKYLEGIERELQKRLKTSGARSADEQFYSEAHAIFDSVRRAWRNPTMHIEKTYTEERAEEILITVRSFMRHLATKLHD